MKPPMTFRESERTIRVGSTEPSGDGTARDTTISSTRAAHRSSSPLSAANRARVCRSRSGRTARVSRHAAAHARPGSHSSVSASPTVPVGVMSGALSPRARGSTTGWSTERAAAGCRRPARSSRRQGFGSATGQGLVPMRPRPPVPRSLRQAFTVQVHWFHRCGRLRR